MQQVDPIEAGGVRALDPQEILSGFLKMLAETDDIQVWQDYPGEIHFDTRKASYVLKLEPMLDDDEDTDVIHPATRPLTMLLVEVR